MLIGDIKMLCCLGIFAGVAAGSLLGGPWTFIAPAFGFGLGIINFHEKWAERLLQKTFIF
mgnify:CR=1 FL=1